MRKKFAFLAVLAVISLALAGCAAGNPVQQDQNAMTQAESSGTTDLSVQTPADQPASIEQLNNNQSIEEKTKNMTDITKPQMVIDRNKSYTAVMHTDAGDIEIALNAKAVPITANNFVWLAKNNFYDNTIFYRVIKGFMIQGGDPKGDGTGGPGYSFNDEKFTGSYTRGTIAMANSGPNTNGSQFFIMHATYPLPPNYVIFGQVTKGLEVVDKIAEAQVKMSAAGELSQPLAPVKIKSIDIVEK